MKKTWLLMALASSTLVASPEATSKPNECAMAPKDMGKLEKAAERFKELEAEFKKWGVNAVWDQVKGKNSNEVGSRDISTVYTLFSDPSIPFTAVAKDKLISSDPDQNDKSVKGMPHIQKIMDALKTSKDGQVTFEYTRMEKNPADKDGADISVTYTIIAWDQRAFEITDHNFFVFQEIRA